MVLGGTSVVPESRQAYGSIKVFYGKYFYDPSLGFRASVLHS